VDIRKRLNAAYNDLLQHFGRIRIGEIDDCLYARKQVLAPMLRFPSQRGDLFLTSLLLGNIPRDLGRSNNLAFGVFEGRNGQ
jgi:hypothetical protein